MSKLRIRFLTDASQNVIGRAIFTNHAELQPALAGSLSAPKPFEESKVTSEDQKQESRSSRRKPTWAQMTKAPSSREVSEDEEADRHQNDC